MEHVADKVSYRLYSDGHKENVSRTAIYEPRYHHTEVHETGDMKVRRVEGCRYCSYRVEYSTEQGFDKNVGSYIKR